MTNTTMRTRLLASSMISGAAVAAMSATTAQAQAVEAAPAPATSVQELVVTGSRIPQRNLTSVSPITTINNQSVKLQGTTNVEDLINNLPQAFADFGVFEINGSSGTSTIDLRGLGNVRTLVLVDGKRLQPGDPLLPVADINMIPPALIDRVEVLTGGASAVYGSDAVAGVVNFIMKHNYQGLQIDSEFSIGEHDNNSRQARAANAVSESFGLPNTNLPSGAVWAGARWTATITGGANTPDDKGNVEFYLGYSHIAAVNQATYDWSKCSLATNSSNTNQSYCLGSSNDATGRLVQNATNGLVSNGVNVLVLYGYDSHGNPIYRPPNFAPSGYDVSIPNTSGPLMTPFNPNQDFNFAPYQLLQREDQRYTAGEFSHYEVAPWLDAYSSFMFMDDQTVAHLGPSAAFLGDTYSIHCNNPLLTTQQLSTLCDGYAGDPNTVANFILGRRNVEGGPRVFTTTHDDYRIVFGIKGDIGSGWSYDVSAQWGQSFLTDVDTGQFLVSHVRNALDVVPNPAVGGVSGVPAGTPVCAAAISGLAATCVPWDIWNPGGVTQDALNYVQGTAADSGFTTEQVVTGNITGDLGQYGMKSPMASDGIGISLGAEYRREFLQFTPDEVEQSGDISGSGTSAPVVGSQSDKDVFGEIRIPLIQNMAMFKDLTFEGGARYSDYTSGGTNWTYKAGLDWQIVPDLRLRGSYERAVRAPNVDELFAPQVQSLFGGGDPCSGVSPTYSEAQCALTGVQPGQYGGITPCVSGQCGLVTGGNPDLTPEIGKTWSVGAVFTPTFFRGFSASVDYFNIVVDNAVTVIPAQQILAGCALQDIALDCANISRNGNGLLFGTGGFVRSLNINAASLKTSGIDINADYRASLADWHLGDVGSLDFNFTGTWVHSLSTTLLGVGTWDCAGLYGLTCGTPAPQWRHQFRVSWTTPWNLTLSVNWRYLAPTNLDFNSSQPLLAAASPYGTDFWPTDAHIPAFNYFDVSFQYKFRNRYTIRGGVNNIFDRTPPIMDTNSFGISAPPAGNANTFPQVFDPLGRVLFVGLTADF
ncbi:MAG: TonB-dependent receptor plug domain-containing protein [Caulobacteraceae bacterium]